MSAASGVATPRTLRFGPFELDVRSGELRKHGIKIRLHQQPFRILLMLLRQPGEVVLREEIRKELGPMTPLSSSIMALTPLSSGCGMR